MDVLVSICVTVILYPFLKKGFKELIWDITMYIIIPILILIKRIKWRKKK